MTAPVPFTGSDVRSNSNTLAKRYDRAMFNPDARSIYGASDFFNVGDWSEVAAGPHGALGDAARRLVKRHLAVDAPDSKVKVVLDVGCGLGAGAAMMADHYAGALVVGINISQAQVGHAARNVPAARFAVADAARLAIRSSVVDRIHCVEAAMHFATRAAFFREAHRALRPGGRLIVSDIIHARRIPFIVPRENLCAGQGEYEQICRSAGFVIDACEDITDVTFGPFRDHVKVWKRASYYDRLRRAEVAYLFSVLTKPRPGSGRFNGLRLRRA